MIYEWDILIQAFFTLFDFKSDNDVFILIFRISDFEKVFWIHKGPWNTVLFNEQQIQAMNASLSWYNLSID